MCETCHLGHSPPENRLVICDSCLRGFHQLCAVPLIQAEVVDSPAPWFCGECDAKMAEGRERVDVCEEGKGWTTGQGESKEVETREEEKALVLQQQQLDGTVAGEVAMQVEEEEREEDEYAEKHKREWLESLPLKTLVEYVLSIEKSTSSFPFPSPLSFLPCSLPPPPPLPQSSPPSSPTPPPPPPSQFTPPPSPPSSPPSASPAFASPSHATPPSPAPRNKSRFTRQNSKRTRVPQLRARGARR